MGKFVLPLVIASAAVAQGFVKGGYNDPNPTTSVTFVNRGGPGQIATTGALPTVTLNVNGAHTLAGEVILHHVVYNGNGGQLVNAGTLPLPLGGNPYNRALTQVIQLHGTGRTQNSGNLALPSNGGDWLSQYLTPTGLTDGRNMHLNAQGPSMYQIDEHRIPGINSGAVYQQLFPQQTLKPQMQTTQILTQTRPQISQQVQQIGQQMGQQQQQQQRAQATITQISQLQQRPGSSLSGQQISQRQQQNNQMTFQPGTRKPNDLTVLDGSDGTGDRSGRLPGMPTIAEITSQLGMNGPSTKSV